MAFNLVTKIWQTGSLDWWGMIDGEDLYLGNREFPQPPEEGDKWVVKATGDMFQIVNGEIVKTGHQDVSPEPWEV